MSRILVVDDDQVIRELLRECLSAEGHEVCEAASAEEALKLIASGIKFDVMVTDMEMPGQSGAELIGGLRQRGFRQRMVVVSGQSWLDVVPGADDVIAKPFHLERLIDAVRRSD
ncbi:MAG: response regulator [Patescibacteria group bacterium]|jgi:CheY-like chemotaxis protein